MNVSEAIASRHSVRAFIPTPVPEETVRWIIETACRSPSGGNLQPWLVWVVAGEDLSRFKAYVREKILAEPLAENPLGARLGGETPEYDIYPPRLPEPYRSRRFACGEALYASIGIPRSDRVGRFAQLAQNFDFYGAPCALFFVLDRCMNHPQWADMGMFIQSVMLLARERGLHSCAQECWALLPETVGRFLEIPANLMLFCGMALGYADDVAPINGFRTARAPLDEVARFRGFGQIPSGGA